jgi:RNA polymerase sigma factor (sigma-70 family)
MLVGKRVTDLGTTFEAFLAGDNSAFAPLYRELNPRLSTYCHKLSPGHTDDLMQELWERVIAMKQRADRTKARIVDSPQAFLFRMLKNLAIDQHRKIKNEIALNGDMEDASHATHPSYSTKLEESTDIECIILDALEKLPADDREVLVLNIYSGYDFGEIAEMLGKSADAIWQRASRARVKLRKIVIEDANRMGVPLPRMNGSMTASQKKKATV